MAQEKDAALTATQQMMEDARNGEFQKVNLVVNSGEVDTKALDTNGNSLGYHIAMKTLQAKRGPNPLDGVSAKVTLEMIGKQGGITLTEKDIQDFKGQNPKAKGKKDKSALQVHLESEYKGMVGRKVGEELSVTIASPTQPAQVQSAAEKPLTPNDKLLAAAGRGDVAGFKKALDQGADINNAMDSQKNNALNHLAAWYSNQPSKEVLAYGGPSSREDKPIDDPARDSFIQIFSELKSKGFDFNSPDSQRATASLLSNESQHKSSMGYAIAREQTIPVAPVQASDSSKPAQERTPEQREDFIVEDIKKHYENYDKGEIQKQQDLAKTLAESKSEQVSLSSSEVATSKPAIKDKDQNKKDNALLAAAKEGRLEEIQKALESGADPYFTDKKGKNALQLLGEKSTSYSNSTARNFVAGIAAGAVGVVAVAGALTTPSHATASVAVDMIDNTFRGASNKQLPFNTEETRAEFQKTVELFATKMAENGPPPEGTYTIGSLHAHLENASISMTEDSSHRANLGDKKPPKFAAQLSDLANIVGEIEKSCPSYLQQQDLTQSPPMRSEEQQRKVDFEKEQPNPTIGESTAEINRLARMDLSDDPQAAAWLAYYVSVLPRDNVPGPKPTKGPDGKEIPPTYTLEGANGPDGKPILDANGKPRQFYNLSEEEMMKDPEKYTGKMYINRLDSKGKAILDEQGNPVVDIVELEQGKVMAVIKGAPENEKLGYSSIHPDMEKAAERNRAADLAKAAEITTVIGVEPSLTQELPQVKTITDEQSVAAINKGITDQNGPGADATAPAFKETIDKAVGIAEGIKLVPVGESEPGKYRLEVPADFKGGVAVVPHLDEHGQIKDDKVDVVSLNEKGEVTKGVITEGSSLDAATQKAAKEGVEAEKALGKTTALGLSSLTEEKSLDKGDDKASEKTAEVATPKIEGDAPIQPKSLDKDTVDPALKGKVENLSASATTSVDSTGDKVVATGSDSLAALKDTTPGPEIDLAVSGGANITPTKEPEPITQDVNKEVNKSDLGADSLTATAQNSDLAKDDKVKSEGEKITDKQNAQGEQLREESNMVQQEKFAPGSVDGTFKAAIDADASAREAQDQAEKEAERSESQTTAKVLHEQSTPEVIKGTGEGKEGHDEIPGMGAVANTADKVVDLPKAGESSSDSAPTSKKVNLGSGMSSESSDDPTSLDAHNEANKTQPKDIPAAYGKGLVAKAAEQLGAELKDRSTPVSTDNSPLGKAVADIKEPLENPKVVDPPAKVQERYAKQKAASTAPAKQGNGKAAENTPKTPSVQNTSAQKGYPASLPNVQKPSTNTRAGPG